MLNNTCNQKEMNNSNLDLTLAHDTGKMSSLDIAEVTGKEHKNVMRDIRNLVENLKDINGYKFELVEYRDKKGEMRPMYELGKKECLLLASGYDVVLRAKIINRWEELEKKERQPKELSRKDLALMVIKSEEEKERLQIENDRIKEQNELQEKQLKEQAPDVEYTKKVLSASNTYSINLIAKEMGMSGVTLNAKLKEKGVQYKQGGVWVLTHKYQNKGYTSTRTHIYTSSDGKERTSMLTVWTERGRKFIHDLFKAA